MSNQIRNIIKKGMGKVATFSFYINLGRKCSNIKIKRNIALILSPIGIVSLLFNNKKIIPKYKLSIVLIIKNEAPYIEEWIEYYKLLGFDRMYIYDNDSNDNPYSKIKKYIQTGLVKYTKISGRARQLDAYNDALKIAKKESKYLAILDADEFLFPVKNIDVYSIIDKYISSNPHVGGVGINWLIFGSGGQIVKKTGLVTQRFYFRSNFNFVKNQHVKTICDPRKVAGILNPHIVQYNYGCYAIDSFYRRLDKPFTEYNPDAPLRINHYFTKSKNEFIEKKNRGEADTLNMRTMEDFKLHDRNEVFDDSMKRYKDKLEELVEKRKSEI